MGLGRAHVLVWGCIEGLLSGNAAVSPYPQGRHSKAPDGSLRPRQHAALGVFCPCSPLTGRSAAGRSVAHWTRQPHRAARWGHY